MLRQRCLLSGHPMSRPDKRAFPRVQGMKKQYASFPGGTALIRDLSLGGVMLRDREPLATGSPVTLNLHLGLETVSCSGVVRWSEPRSGMGIQFVEMAEPARRRLSHCVMEMAVEVNRQKLNEGFGSAAQGSRARTDGSATKEQGSAPSQPASPSSLGELLVQRGVISPQQLVAATPVGRQHGGQFASTLVRLGFVSEEDLVAVVQQEYRLPVIDLATVEPIAEVIRLVPLAIARRYQVLPIGATAAILTIAIADPSNFAALREIKARTGCELRIVLAPALAIQRAIDRFYDSLAREAG